MKFNGLDRRSLLGLGARSVLGVGLGSALFQRSAFGAGLLAGKNPRPARACILLYMQGGPSHIDTWDPKPGRPTGGTFKAIRSAVPGLQVSEHLPKLAARAKRLAVVRSVTSKEGNHDRARHLMHTAHIPQGGADHPGFGSIVAESRPTPGMPGYVAIGGPGQDPGFLEARYSPFPVKNPLKPVRHLAPAKGMNADRFAQRIELWRGLESRFAATRGGAFAHARRAIGEQAFALMNSSGARAFDVNAEPEALRETYGATEFGHGCLMARRLVEAGVPFVEVVLNGWDTHENGFERVAKLSATLDQGMSALLDDLAARGLLDSTLLVWMGDFGRTPRINERGGRDHYPAAFSVVLGGGGVKGGQVVGSTDEDGRTVRDRPVTIPDLYRTVAHALDVNADKVRVAPSGRPIRAIDGGTVIAGLL